MKILLFGHQGQIGSALIHACPTAHSIVTSDIDISDTDAVRDIILSTAPDIIINAAAYTNVDGAEENKDIAFRINADAPRMMAETAKQKDILLIHYSTDYVFDGHGKVPWVETDTPNPLNIYGQSKLKGDEYIIESGCRHLIFRTSWVYDQTHENFVTKILKLSKEREHISVVSDQIGAPTSANFIATSTFHTIAQQDKTGLYHLCCAGETSWFDFTKLIVATKNSTSTCNINPILSKDYAQKAQRPCNSRLNCNKWIKDFSLSPPEWNEEFLTIFR